MTLDLRSGCRSVALGLLVAGASCMGTVDERSDDVDEAGDVPPKPDHRPPEAVELPWPVKYEGHPSALRRLSRDELITSMEMLTGTAPARHDLPEEQRPEHGVLITSGMPYIGNELGKLDQVVVSFAAKVAPAVLDQTRCATTEQPQRDCLLAWSQRFLEQALRRSQRAEESALFQKIFESAGRSREADLAAVEDALAAVFFSPSFLYRTEIGRPVSGNSNLRALTDNEIAARLSYLASLAPPDAELLEAARAGRLKDGAERVWHFDRLSQGVRGKRAQTVFVLEWLGANESKVNQKSQKYLADLGADFETSIRDSAEAAIRRVTEREQSTIGEFLLTQAYLGDPAVRRITDPAGTGGAATGDTHETRRAGLMMHPFVLAAHTKEDGPSPFQIGLFMREALLCESVAPPPPDAAASARNDPPEGLSQREDLEYRTGVAPICQFCHAQFSTFGYSFLPFDPVGRWVRQDPSGKPWDLSGNVETYSGTPVTFQSPNELMHRLVDHPQVQGCFARAALEWAFGRHLVMEDHALLGALHGVAQRTRGDLAAIMRTIVAAPDFVNAVAPR
jgi:hypothetical protein